eukprot:CAMPEP_0170591516 /NCGR_PEP_ID=MMETSP0224-20130122/12445_1 /TAXON_ID=285029 /ORGANISM="Togula jolla, Strain CCCM 725" /LENGTH=667 /DNA_ID=CAMNT_0010915385 /DNA_START=59 /DNA_END=2062 /DNA_ORIENTATION=+
MSAGKTTQVGPDGRRVADDGPKTMAGTADKLAVKILLGRSGLEDYCPYFEKAGYKLLDAPVRLTDAEVEDILSDVETECKMIFNPDIRTELWKALRSAWFQGPGHRKAFIRRDTVPQLFLPKRDFKDADSQLDPVKVDPDRQRQFLRKETRTRPVGLANTSGPLFTTLQFEVYQRESDLHYRYLDLARCIKEWQQKDPRRMLREDPREEALKIRLRGIVLLASAALRERKQEQSKTRQIVRLLLGIRHLSLVMSVFMFYVAYSRYSNSPREVMFEYVTSSNQFIAGVTHIVTFMFVKVVLDRRHSDPTIRMLQRMLISCERHMEHISEFRVETEAVRLTGGEADTVETDNQGKGKKSKSSARRRKKEKKRKKEEKEGTVQARELAIPSSQTEDMREMKLIKRALADSAKRLPALDEGFRRPGGDRMEAFRDRYTPVDVNQLCVRTDASAAARKLGVFEEEAVMLSLHDRSDPGRAALANLGFSSAEEDEEVSPTLPLLPPAERPALDDEVSPALPPLPSMEKRAQEGEEEISPALPLLPPLERPSQDEEVSPALPLLTPVERSPLDEEVSPALPLLTPVERSPLDEEVSPALPLLTPVERSPLAEGLPPDLEQGNVLAGTDDSWAGARRVDSAVSMDAALPSGSVDSPAAAATPVPQVSVTPPAPSE